MGQRPEQVLKPCEKLAPWLAAPALPAGHGALIHAHYRGESLLREAESPTAGPEPVRQGLTRREGNVAQEADD